MNNSANWWPIMGAVIVVCVIIYFGFQTVDVRGLENQAGTATVTGKEHRPPGKTYRTEVVAGRTRTIPQHTSDTYVVKFTLDGKEFEHPVDREFFEAVGNGDRLAVTYQKRRLTGGVQVVSVRGEGR
jgi:hypothetical protein